MKTDPFLYVAVTLIALSCIGALVVLYFCMVKAERWFRAEAKRIVSRNHGWKVEEGQDLLYMVGPPWFVCAKCGKRELGYDLPVTKCPVAD